MKQFDYSPLKARVSWTKAVQHTLKSLSGIQSIGIFLLVFIFIVLGGAFVVRVLVLGVDWFFLLSMSTFLLIPGFIVFQAAQRAKRQIKLRRFAKVNQLEFQENIENPVRSGMIFHEGHSKKLRASLTIQRDSGQLEIGNYQYVTGSGKNRTTYDFGFIAFSLPRRLPHMVLDAKSNNFLSRFSNLPTVFDRDQILSLQGGFDEHFTLYAPKEYETDAFYVFTPDVMQAAIDTGGEFDMEVIDDRFYLYSSRPLKIDEPSVLQHLLGLSNHLSGEIIGQVDYYSDEKIGDRTKNVVAEPGRRLEKGVPWLIIFFIAFAILFQFGPMVLGWFFG